MRARVLTLVLATATTIAFAGTASAADIPAPVYIPPPVFTPPPPTPFAGFYLGGHAGYGWANRAGCADTNEDFVEVCNLDPNEDLDFDYDQNGWIAGGQVGYNHFIGDSRIMIGAEVTASLSGITGNLENDQEFEDLPEDYRGIGDWTYLATATAKIGITPLDKVLFYAEGGLGLGGFRFNSANCNFDSNHQGWVAGIGAEAQVSTNNTLFIEWNHMDFDGKDAHCGAGDPNDVAVFTKPEIDVLRFGFNHYFN